ncbi:DUF4209 domain-containing protein [Opitutaceae bacterium]
MSNPRHLFTGDRSALAGIDINQPIAGYKAENCATYMQAYAGASKTAAAKGETEAAAAFRFLNAITGFAESFDTPLEPFVAFARFPDSRSPIPSDLSADDVEALRLVAPKAADPSLRARLHDVLWVLVKDVPAGQEAARAYLEAGKIQNSGENWIYAVGSFKRALQLAAGFGRTKPLFQDVLRAVEDAAKTAASDKDNDRAPSLIRILLDARSSDPAVFGPMLATLAVNAEAAGHYRLASDYREQEGEWRLAAGDQAAAKAARLAGAEAAVKLAELRATSQDKSALAACSLLVDAIELLRRAGAPKTRVDEARKRLAELQAASLDEMQTFSVPFDFKDAAKQAQEHVQGKNFQVALAKFVLGVPLADPAKVRQDVIDIAQQAPLTHLMKAAIVDGKGRTTAVKPGVLGASADEAEAAMQAEMFSHAAQFIWTIRARAYINPARQQIRNEHFPTFADLAFMVTNNPFVPPGHEGIFLRGLHAGFHGDFLIAAHLLTPQIENSLRYLFEAHGVDVSIFKSDGTQPVKILGGLLEHSEATKILSEPLVFELRGCLIEKTGFDLRNRVAHGFVSVGECSSEAVMVVWWLVLRICLWPHLLIRG